MLSRSIGMPSRREGPPSIWDTHGISGNVFANPTASSSTPYPGGDQSLDFQCVNQFYLANSTLANSSLANLLWPVVFWPGLFLAWSGRLWPDLPRPWTHLPARDNPAPDLSLPCNPLSPGAPLPHLRRTAQNCVLFSIFRSHVRSFSLSWGSSFGIFVVFL